MKGALVLLTILVAGAPAFAYGSQRSGLPPVSTGSVSLNILDSSNFAAPQVPMANYSGGSSGQGGDPTAGLPPSPGPGYQPIFQHGVFVGYMDPDTIALMQTDPTSAWTNFANSPNFVGGAGLQDSLLAETGAISPDQQAALDSMALYGM